MPTVALRPHAARRGGAPRAQRVSGSPYRFLLLHAARALPAGPLEFGRPTWRGTRGVKAPTRRSTPFPINLPLGTWVETANGKIRGRLRFLGPIQDKVGLWAGIELATLGSGKNDGAARGVRYFTCPANSGIFVPARTVRPATRSTGSAQKPATPGPPQLGQCESPSGPRAAFVPAPQRAPTPSLTASGGAPDKFGGGSSRDLNAGLKLPIQPRPRLGQSPGSDNAVAARGRPPTSALPQPRGEAEGFGGDLSDYLSSNANPTLVIQSLVSQLYSYRKRNELLQLRINKKRAHYEATRVLRTEFIDRARHEIQSRGGSSPPIAACDADIKRRLAHVDSLLTAVGPLPEMALETAPGGELVGELRQRLDDLRLIHAELQSLYRQLVTREGLLARLQDPPDGAKFADPLAELDALRRDSSQEIDALREEIRKLKANPSEPSSFEVAALQRQLGDTEAKVQAVEEVGAEARCHARCERFSEEIQRLTREQPNPPDAQLEESQALIQKLKLENAELHDALEAYLNDEKQPISNLEPLPAERDPHREALHEAQKENENLMTQIQALKSALAGMEAGQGSASEFPRASETESARAAELERRVLQLEEELALAQAFSDKLRAGSFSEEDMHADLVAELEARAQHVQRLEADLKGLEERYRQLMEANDQLMADAQALEDDNWRIDDMYKAMQEEMERVLAQLNDSKEKIQMLELARDAADPDSARGVNELVQKCEANEALHKAELDGLYKVIDEQDEELTLLADRETELTDEIKSLRAQLAEATRGAREGSLESLDADELQRLDDGTPFCHLCCDTGHEPAACPNPPAEDVEGLEDLDLELALLGDDVVCSDCQQVGHTFEECPNATQVPVLPSASNSPLANHISFNVLSFKRDPVRSWGGSTVISPAGISHTPTAPKPSNPTVVCGASTA
ncbi:hypothetical protein L0F63_002677, partial [Massospora cicadina]